jgi:general secretion pathway protein L
MQVTFNQIKATSLRNALRLLRNWWLEEFWNLWPDRFVKWLSGPQNAVLLLVAKEDGASLELLNSERALVASEKVDLNANVSELIERLLKTNQLTPQETDVGLRLPEQCFFTRELQLPSVAWNEIEEILAQDMLRKTPFKPEDIFCGHVATASSDGSKILVRQSIVRRQYVDSALSSFDFGISKLAFITSRRDSVGYGGCLINLKKAADRDLWLRKLTFVLCCSALALLVIGGGLKYWWQQQEIDRLGIELATTNKKAQQVRALADQLQQKKGALVHLRIRRGELPGVIDLWEETTRILPAHTWLTELRLSEASGQHGMQVAISGFSGAAPGLVGIVDGSPLFSDAVLTSPIAFDSAEGRERFSLQAKVKTPEMLKEAAR